MTDTDAPAPFIVPEVDRPLFETWKKTQPEGAIPPGTSEEKLYKFFKEVKSAQTRAENTRIMAGISKEVDAANEVKQGIARKKGEGAVESPLIMDYRRIAQARWAKGDLVSFAGSLHRYENGYFHEDKDRVNGEILSLLVSCGLSGKESIVNATTQVKHFLLYENMSIQYPFNPRPDAINVNNGVVVFDFKLGKARLVDPSPEFLFNYKLAVDYDPMASPSPAQDYLDSLGVDTRVLVQIPSQAILMGLGRIYKKAYFLIGPKDCGKSTFAKLTTNYLFGRDMCSALSLHDLLFEKFRLAELDGKLINSYSDLSATKISNLGMFKALTGDDDITVERKHKDSYKLRNKAVLLFSANRFPKISGIDDAFMKRWIPVEFKNCFIQTADYDVKTFTRPFVSGFFNLVIDRVCRMATDPTDVLTTTDVMEMWLTDMSSAYAYVKDRIEKCTDAVIPKSELYADYVAYCDDKELEKEAQREVSDAIKVLGARTDARPVLGGRQQHCYQGITFKNRNPIYPDAYDQANQKKLVGD
ncbi:MAG: DUF5906 domain-containing protein [Methanoregula sp.]|jgi:P4 family phage/plasmid primase-like protien|uniref:DNA primase family protein n=1 Tax=Methanoregula sp. TaxID=2052170 RepID=UPI003D0E5CDB